MFYIALTRFSLEIRDVDLLKGFLWTRRQLGTMAHYGHPANLLPKCDRSFPEFPQYIYSISAVCSSLTCKKVMLTVRSCACCPGRDQTRTSPGRVREMCEVCVQRHCCEVHLIAFLCAHGSEKHSRVSQHGTPKPGTRVRASSGSPARPDLTGTVSVQQQSLLPGLVAVLLCCWDRISSFKTAFVFLLDQEEGGHRVPTSDSVRFATK